MITPENYEGWLMRYADGELTAAERRQVEAFLAEHPDLREELDEVSSVRVAPLVATMPGKERLLRREPAAVWHRVAAAVALLVVAGTTLFFLNRPAEGEMIAELPASTDTLASPPAPLPQERGVDSISVSPVDLARPASPQAAEKYLAEAATDAPHNPENPEKLERLEYLVEPERLERLERLDNLAKLDSPDTLEAPPVPAPRPTATLGIVVEDARLASNPWRQLLAFND